jgi:hypothetical protein
LKHSGLVEVLLFTLANEPLEQRTVFGVICIYTPNVAVVLGGMKESVGWIWQEL